MGGNRLVWLLLGLLACASLAIAGDRRDIVFDCPCGAEFVAGAEGENGTLRLSGGLRSLRAVESGPLRLSANRWGEPVGASAVPLPAHDRRRGEWEISLGAPAAGAVIEIHLFEEAGRIATDGGLRWHQHEALALWPVPSDETPGLLRFVDILTDSDGDGVGDVNERLAGTLPDDPGSTPDDETVVDVLALYTSEFAAAESGYPYTGLLHAISVASAMFEDSATGVRLRLVGMSEVELDDSGWARADLRDELMDSHGADVPMQFSLTGPCAAGGCARLGFERTTRWSEGRAWAITTRPTLTAHELGHVMGLTHSARQGEAHGAWRWSRGHYVTPHGDRDRLGTIMAYGSNVMNGVFSDPSRDCGLGPCGVAAHEFDGADSVTALDLLRHQIGAHRASGVDSDGDGIVDAADTFPDDPDDWFDVDGDGTGDNADPDDDNDGTPDIDDPFPLDPAEWADADGDGLGDNADADVRDLSPFRDPALRTAVEAALGKPSGAPVSAEDMASLGKLEAGWRDIRDLTGLEHATGLVELYLRGNRIENLEPLSGLTDLERLDVAYNAVTDLSPLNGLDSLWLLYLDRNPVDDVSPLAELPALRCVYLSHTGVAFADVRELPRFARFHCLGIGGLGVADLSVLSELDLWGLDLSDNAIADIGPLENLARLVNLILDGNAVSDLGPVADLVELERLYLNGNAVSDLAPLENLVKLEQLYLDGNAVSDLGPLVNLVKLEHLNLNGNMVSNLGSLANLVELERLYLNGNAVSDLAPLENLVKLKRLYLNGNTVSDLEPLTNLVELERLYLDGSRVSDLAPLAGMTSMDSLDLDSNAVTDLGPLEGLSELTWLMLGGNQISDVSPLADLTDLDSLSLADNAVFDIGPLERMANLRWLLLKNNRIADVSPLSAMTGMRWLYLDSNAIVDIGPIVRRSVFGGNASTGAYVNLDYNPLDDASRNDHIPTLKSWGVQVRYSSSGSRGGGVASLMIADPTLRALIADALAQSALHVDDPANRLPIGSLDELRLYNQGIVSLSGVEAASGLENLYAASNRIADLSPLAGLAELRELDLRNNRVSDLSPLVENADLGKDDWVALDGNPLSQESVNTHVPALLDRGVKVSVGTVVLSVVAGEAPARFDVSGYFRALLGENPTLAASSGDASLATVAVAGGAITVTPGARAGAVTVTVKATNSTGETAALDFLVRVRGPWLVPLVPNASGSRQGFVRIANLDARAGEVRILPVDDEGYTGGPLTLTIDAGETVHFNSDDLERGNAGKGLVGSAGERFGDWRLALRSDLDLDVLSYVRTRDGFLTSMHDVAPRMEDGHQVPTFNPASNYNQRSLLRISNLGGEDAEVTIGGVDDAGASPGTEVVAQVRAGASLLLSADDLEKGGSGLTGALGDGQGKWRLRVRSTGELSVMSLMASPGGHLTNLSTSAPAALKRDGVHTVPLFPSASDPLGRQGFVRVVNLSDVAGDVRIVAHDDTGLAYDALTLALDAGRTAHFNSDDLELGSPAKGLTGSTGAGRGDWRLELSSELDLDVLAYVRTPSGFLTSMHDVVRSAGRRHDVATFNPGSNWRQESKLRIVNPGTRPAHLTIGGVDDGAKTPGDVVRLTVPVGAAVTVTAPQLEAGDYAFHDRQRAGLGDGRGKWRLLVDSEQPIFLVNVLASPTGHLTNLSTSPNR